jgi:hypothetical protein
VKHEVSAFIAGMCVMLAIVVGITFIVTTLNPTAADGSPESIAQKFGVEIVWDADLHLRCGGYACFSPATPDLIYVKPGLSDDETKRVVLHELGHVVEYRLGIPLDECNADRFAAALGATWGSYCQSDAPH